MGNANNYLSIDKDTGDIHVTQDDFFDYHRQSELFVQVSFRCILSTIYLLALDLVDKIRFNP